MDMELMKIVCRVDRGISPNEAELRTDGALRAPPATAGIVFSDDWGELSEEAFLHDFAGDLPPEEARVLYAAQQVASPKPSAGKRPFSLKAHKQLPALRAALEAHQSKHSHGCLACQAIAA
jgi:hypothetical protein